MISKQSTAHPPVSMLYVCAFKHAHSHVQLLCKTMCVCVYVLQAKWIQTKHIMYPFNLDRVLPYLLFITQGSVLRKMRHQMATICIWYKQFHWHVTNIAYVNTLFLEKALIISNLDHVLYLPFGFVTYFLSLCFLYSLLLRIIVSLKHH